MSRLPWQQQQLRVQTVLLRNHQGQTTPLLPQPMFPSLQVVLALALEVAVAAEKVLVAVTLAARGETATTTG